MPLLALEPLHCTLQAEMWAVCHQLDQLGSSVGFLLIYVTLRLNESLL